jgi:RNase adapter protein RapZ
MGSSERPDAGPRTRLVIVTGMSGAGRTSALKALEDMGYEAVDNLPLSLLGSLVRSEGLGQGGLAIDVDIRTRGFSAERFRETIAGLFARPDIDGTLLFIDCDDDVLRRRFTETRRRHPLAKDRPVSDGIAQERRMIDGLRARADQVIDTTGLSVADLRRIVTGAFAPAGGVHPSVFVTSFAYRQGLPRDADLVFDVRFLENPHYVDALRPMSGLDREVGAFIEKDPSFASFMDRLEALVIPLLPRYEHEGKMYLTIAIGCTGGRHRSVFVAERLGAAIARAGLDVRIAHRDLGTGGGAPASLSENVVVS